MIVHEKKTKIKIFNVRFFNIEFTLKIEILFWGNYQNISCSILLRLGKTNIFSSFLKSFGSSAIIKIKIKKLDDDYNYFSLTSKT